MITAIIDGDFLSYSCSKDTLWDSKRLVDERIYNMLTAINADSYYLFLSYGPYFRHEINEDYKGNRPVTDLKFVNELKQHMATEWNGKHFDRLEADDIAAYAKRNLKDRGIVCTPDKDLLKQVSGRHYDYRTKEFVETSAEEAKTFLWKQALMGDSGDNIKGIDGIGPKKADKLLARARTPADYPGMVLNAYIFYNGSNISKAINEFQKNFRQVYLLRTSECFEQEVGYVPNIGEPTVLN